MVQLCVTELQQKKDLLLLYLFFFLFFLHFAIEDEERKAHYMLVDLDCSKKCHFGFFAILKAEAQFFLG